MRFNLVLALAALAVGCASSPPVPPPPPPPPLVSVEPPAEVTPQVIRRLLAEERELVDRTRTLAAELPDPRGQQRALAEVGEIADALARLEAPLDSTDSASLDAAVDQLIREGTKIALLHEALRTATNRTTALGSD